MPIELHAFDTPNGRKISVALEEMALPYVVTIVDIRKGQQFDPEFLKISPNGKIPAIVDPDGPDGKPVSVFCLSLPPPIVCFLIEPPLIVCAAYAVPARATTRAIRATTIAGDGHLLLGVLIETPFSRFASRFEACRAVTRRGWRRNARTWPYRSRRDRGREESGPV